MAFAAAIVLVCGVAVTGCDKGGGENGGTYSETYTGAVSEATYKSAELAVQGFLETELSDMACTAVYVGYTKQTDLTEQEIAGLPLGEGDAANISLGEKGTVEYSESENMDVPYPVRAASEETFTQELYLLNYESGEYRYFTPALKENDSLTASYFNSLFAPENYINCTMELNMKNGWGEETAELSVLFKNTSDGAHRVQETNCPESFGGNKIQSYIFESENEIFQFVKYDDNG